MEEPELSVADLPVPPKETSKAAGGGETIEIPTSGYVGAFEGGREVVAQPANAARSVAMRLTMTKERSSLKLANPLMASDSGA